MGAPQLGQFDVFIMGKLLDGDDGESVHGIGQKPGFVAALKEKTSIGTLVTSGYSQ
jgi:hypothetical protein